MRRRLDLALSLVHEPAVLFLDEPTTGLDPMSRIALWEEVRRLNEDHGMTVLLTTQYLEEADQLADRIAIIDHGRIVREGRADDLKAAVGAPTLRIEVAAGRGGAGPRSPSAGHRRAPARPRRRASASACPTGRRRWPRSCGPSTRPGSPS